MAGTGNPAQTTLLPTRLPPAGAEGSGAGGPCQAGRRPGVRGRPAVSPAGSTRGHGSNRRQASVSQLLVPSVWEHPAGVQVPWAVPGKAMGRLGAPHLPPQRYIPLQGLQCEASLPSSVEKVETDTVLLTERYRHGGRGEPVGPASLGARWRAGGSPRREKAGPWGQYPLRDIQKKSDFLPTRVCRRDSVFPTSRTPTSRPGLLPAAEAGRAGVMREVPVPPGRQGGSGSGSRSN